jgi:hypothetical protein
MLPHWARAHVNPMLALRNIACNDRWAEAWPQLEQQRRHQDRMARAQRQQQRRWKRHSVAVLPQSSRPADGPIKPTVNQAAKPAPVSKPRHPSGKSHPPAENHPWRHRPIGRAVFLPRKKRSDAKV